MAVRRVLVCFVALAIAIGTLPATASAASPSVPSSVVATEEPTDGLRLADSTSTTPYAAHREAPSIEPLAVADPEFEELSAFTGLDLPTVVRFSSDGRVFVGEKGGKVKVFDSMSDTTASTVIDISAETYGWWDRGMLGMALDPNFPSEPWVYLLTTTYRGRDYGDDCPYATDLDAGCMADGRLVRYQVSPTNVASNRQVLLEGNWCQQYPSHSIGTVEFGTAGELYVGGGDGASFNFSDYGQGGGRNADTPKNPCGDPPVPVGGTQAPTTGQGGALRSQDLRTAGDPVTWSGAILRVDPDTGSPMPNNPLVGQGSTDDDRIVAYGLRNPFRFTVQPTTGELWIGDVGWGTWEEINRHQNPTQTVRNFGWPCYEGNARQSGYDSLNNGVCETMYGDATAHTPPVLPWNHSSPLAGCGGGSSSVAGLAFYEGGSYPDAYDGALFFSDFSRQCIWVMYPGAGGVPNPATVELFASQVGTVGLEIGPGGDLFAVDHFGGRIVRYRYTVDPENTAPVAAATANPTSGASPLVVNFSGTGSTDADGDPLTYEWDLDGDGAFDDAAGSTAQFTYITPGTHTATLRVNDGRGGSDTDQKAITVTPASGSGDGYITLPGTAGVDIASGPSPTFDITGDLDLRADIALNDWDSPSAKFISNLITGTGAQGYELMLNGTTKGLRVAWVDAGGTLRVANSTVALPVSDGQRLQIRGVLDVNNGAGGHTVTFFYRTDTTPDVEADTGWTQLGGTVNTGTGTTSVNPGDQEMVLGGRVLHDVEFWSGRYYAASIINGTTGGGQVRGDLDFGTTAELTSTPPDYSEWTDTPGNVWEVNGTGWGYVLGANQPPTAVLGANPASGPTPLQVSFTATSSTDPDGDPLSYAWDLDGDGQLDDSMLATPGFTYATPGGYPVTLRVSDGRGGVDTDTVTITATDGNTAPTATINTPDGSALWKVGDTIAFTGSASDPNETLGASSMSWRLVIHHCAHDDPNNCHQHGINDWNGVAGGSFVAPDHEFPSHLELTLTVTDSGGKTGSDSVRLDPRTVELTFESAPVAGLALSVGAFAERTPFTREVIVGSANSVTAVSPQAKDGIVYGFDSWTDGGAESRLIIAPGTDTTYRAVFLGAPQEQDGYLTLPGTAGTAVSAPAGPNFDAITGTLDIRADVALNNWSTSNAKLISNLRTSSLGSAEGYELILDGTTRRLRLAWVNAAGTLQTRTSTVAIPVADGQRIQLRATLEADNGAGGHTVTFFTRSDVENELFNHSGWTELGSVVTTAGITTVRPGDRVMVLGSRFDQAAGFWSGRYYAAMLINGIGFFGQVVANPDFRTTAQLGTIPPDYSGWADGVGNPWTVGGDGWSYTIGGPNQSPAAAVTANPNQGQAPLTVSLDATGTTDPDGHLLTYAWDLDSDGQFDDGSGATIQTTYPAGTHTATVQANDGHGGTDTASVTVTVSEGPTGGVGHIELPGLAGTRLQTPDNTALDITGDIDLRADVALDNWSTSSAKLLSKSPNAYEVLLNGTTRRLRVVFARAGGAQTVNSTVALPVVNGDRLQVRATIDLDAAAANTKVTFWYRTDLSANLISSTGWTQLGSVITRSGAVAIANSANPLSLGSGPNGVGPWAGEVYQAAVLSGIGGTPAAALDLRTAAQATAPDFSEWTDAAGRAWDVLGTGWVYDPGTPNTVPNAVLIANPQSGTAPLTVSFSASTSTDPDGDDAHLRLGPGWRWAEGRLDNRRPDVHLHGPGDISGVGGCFRRTWWERHRRRHHRGERTYRGGWGSFQWRCRGGRDDSRPGSAGSCRRPRHSRRCGAGRLERRRGASRLEGERL